jgi:hypothetical protein
VIRSPAKHQRALSVHAFDGDVIGHIDIAGDKVPLYAHEVFRARRVTNADISHWHVVLPEQLSGQPEAKNLA